MYKSMDLLHNRAVCIAQIKMKRLPWRSSSVSANGTEDRGFETRHGTRFLGLYTMLCCTLQLNKHRYCMYLSEMNLENVLKSKMKGYK
jgi:hypothetical protein